MKLWEAKTNVMLVGPTISALIAANTNWTYTYKWTAGLVGASIVTVFLFLEETS